MVRLNSTTDNNSIPVRTNLPTSEIYNGLPKYDWIPLTFLNLVLQTGFIPNTRTCSTLLVSQAGLGKTSKLEYLRRFDFVSYELDITPKHIMNFLDLVNDEKKKYLVIPDYIATLGHAKKTTDLARSIFRAMIEEGVIKIDVFGMERDYKRKVKAGLVSGITSDFMNINNRLWKSDGFLSRFLPFSYSHTNQTTEQVITNKRDNIDTISMFDMRIKTKDVIEPIRTVDIDKNIQLITYRLVDQKEAPYRMYDQIVALCKASAVMRDSKEIQQQDVDLITTLSNYINRGALPL